MTPRRLRLATGHETWWVMLGSRASTERSSNGPGTLFDLLFWASPGGESNSCRLITSQVQAPFLPGQTFVEHPLSWDSVPPRPRSFPPRSRSVGSYWVTPPPGGGFLKVLLRPADASRGGYAMTTRVSTSNEDTEGCPFRQEPASLPPLALVGPGARGAPGSKAKDARLPGATRPPRKGFVANLLHLPLLDRRFWFAQAMVALVLVVHLGADVAQDNGVLPVPHFIWTLALLVPVIYAGTAFGLGGSLGTALSATIVLVPEELLTRHTTTELWAGWGVLVMVLVVALLTGRGFEGQQLVARAQAKLADAEVLARSEERFRLAFENNMVGMVLVDGSDRIQMANDSFCRMIGREKREIVGKSSAWFTHPGDKGLTSEMHQRLTAGEVAQVNYSKRYVHNDGRVICVEVSRASAGYSPGPLAYFIVSVKDVTEERSLTGKLSHQALHDPRVVVMRWRRHAVSSSCGVVVVRWRRRAVASSCVVRRGRASWSCVAWSLCRAR